ncbi:MAG: hypothetical protein KIT14_22605 [bacterium]|nr:hypothetical protein [bacterium]
MNPLAPLPAPPPAMPSVADGDAWAVAWLRDVLRRDLTPLETQIAKWAHATHAGVYHVDGGGHAWRRWLGDGNDYTQRITVLGAPGSPGAGGAWGNLARWLAEAERVELKFSLEHAGPYRTGVRFWHRDRRSSRCMEVA